MKAEWIFEYTAKNEEAWCGMQEYHGIYDKSRTRSGELPFSLDMALRVLRHYTGLTYNYRIRNVNTGDIIPAEILYYDTETMDD